jgi:predicted Zn-dependent peptidase
VLATLVGGATTSLLFERIRSARGLTYTTSAWHRSYTDADLFCIDFVVRPENVEQTIDAIEEELMNKVAVGWTAEEVAVGSAPTRRALLLECETSANLAVFVARMRLLPRDPSWSPNAEVAAIRAVTADQLNALAAKLFERPLQRLAAPAPMS